MGGMEDGEKREVNYDRLLAYFIGKPVQAIGGNLIFFMFGWCLIR